MFFCERKTAVAIGEQRQCRGDKRILGKRSKTTERPLTRDFVTSTTARPPDLGGSMGGRRIWKRVLSRRSFQAAGQNAGGTPALPAIDSRRAW